MKKKSKPIDEVQDFLGTPLKIGGFVAAHYVSVGPMLCEIVDICMKKKFYNGIGTISYITCKVKPISGRYDISEIEPKNLIAIDEGKALLYKLTQ